MTATARPQFTIVGAGLGGTLMAAYLGKAGHHVQLYEKRPDPRSGGAPAGRSINLAISTRGIHALQEIGIAEEVLAHAVPMRGRMMHATSGELAFQPYGTRPEHHINSVSRGGLNMALLDAAQSYSTVSLHFESHCTAADIDTAAVHLTTVSTGEQRTVAGDIVVGADGAFSAVRKQMVRRDRFDYRQDYLSHGYKELTIPAAENGDFRLEKNALHIWPRGGFMMIALPNEDGSYTCTLFWPFEGPHSFAAVQSPDEILSFFNRHFPDAVPHLPTLVDDYLSNPVSSLVTVRCGPWYHEDKVVLLGDAAHAVVPFYGQGMNASFEDCTILNECLSQFGPDWQAAFSTYHERRKRNCDALAELALANFQEMRDHVKARRFLVKKTMERVLARTLPGWFVPLYTMISFTRIPYAEAVDRARGQFGKVLAVATAVLLLLAVVIVMLLRS